MDKEQRIIEALCQDYVSVYLVNLEQDVATLLKAEFGTNATQLSGLRLNQETCYSKQIRLYGETYVVKGNQQEFLRVMDRRHLLSELKTGVRYTYRYQSIPNQAGYQYFEVQVIQNPAEQESGNVIIAFRHIDDIVSFEERHQIELEKRLEQEHMQNEMLSAISQIYHSIFRVDLKQDRYEEIFCQKNTNHLMKDCGIASVELAEWCRHFIVQEYQDAMLHFLDLHTLASRLQRKKTILTEYMTVDGNWHQASFIVKRRDEHGEVYRVLYTIRVINVEKHREEQLIAMMENATLANRAKTEFISQVAHDIRTPMNSIFGFMEIAEANLHDPEKIKYSLQKMRIAGNFLKQLMDDVLDISRMESGKMKLHPEKISLEKILDEIPFSMEYTTLEKHLNFHFSIHDIVYDNIVADPLRIKQIYTNVLSNAIKYTPNNGSVDFEVFEEEILDSGSVRIVARIADTGIGMSDEFMEKMFVKFEREANTRVDQISGYGLGLSIVKQLVDYMSGTIEVKSSPGHGSTFCIRIEVPYIKVNVEEKNEIKSIPDLNASSICAGMHVLIAEDNELNREVITELLRMHQISCDCAEDGQLCLERFQKEKEGTYDAILMDMQMPHLNGLEATKQIRSLHLPWAKTIPIVAMTANALNEDVQRCLDAGMNVHLSKPIDMKILLRVLAELKLKKK